MKKMMLIAVMMMTGSFAQADGFECVTQSGDLVLKIFNQTNPNLGTRSAAVMVVSDPAIQYGNRTVARFTAQAGTLASYQLAYVANVDLRYSDSGRRGENLLGTKLGQLKRIMVALDFSYARPVAHGAIVKGTLSWVKRTGEEDFTGLVCRRYLKH